MNERNLWDSVKHPTGLVDMVHVGWVQRLLSSAESCGLPGPEPDLAADGQTRVGPHARKIFEKFAELGIRYVGEPTDSQPGAQRIRPVNEVLAFRKATCVDLCVAFSCAALDAGIYPLILTVTADGGLQRHAIALVPLDRMWAIGCEALLEDGFSRTPLEVDEYALRDVVVEYEDDPAGMWLAIDVQQVTESDGNWKTALSSGAEYVRDWEWDVCVDIGGLRSRVPDRVLPPGGTLRRSWLLLMPSCPRISHPCSLCGRDMVRCHISSAMRSVSFASGQRRRRMLPHRRKEDVVATLLSLW